MSICGWKFFLILQSCMEIRKFQVICFIFNVGTLTHIYYICFGLSKWISDFSKIIKGVLWALLKIKLVKDTGKEKNKNSLSCHHPILPRLPNCHLICISYSFFILTHVIYKHRCLTFATVRNYITPSDATFGTMIFNIPYNWYARSSAKLLPVNVIVVSLLSKLF
jgi:hypothetical protein